MSLAEVERMLASAQAEYEGRAGQARMLIAQVKSTATEVEQLKTRIENLGQISALLSSYADERQVRIHRQIEAIVSRGLQTIFEEDLSLRLDSKMVGRRPEIDFVLVSRIGEETLETSILDSRGGGVAAVAGFLIQAVLALLIPGLRPTLFLDESFAQVSVEYEEALGSFIAELCHRSPLQVILVTHSPAYAASADRSYRFFQVDGVTMGEEVRV